MPQIAPILSYLQDTSKTAPMLLIEGPTTLGRTYQGYKRGGKTEGRERICEETLGAAVWLFGMQTFNKIGDVIGEKALGLKDLGTDVGKDSLRNPFGYVQDKKNLTAVFKLSKIISSAALGIFAMGVVVPKVKMAMTNAIRMNEGLEPYPDKNSPDGKYHPGRVDKFVSLFVKPNKKTQEISAGLPRMDEFLSKIGGKPNPSQSRAQNQPAFTGGALDAALFVSHNLENNTAWRLLSTDGGTLAGRVFNSRTKKEAIEYTFRDSISSLAYIFAAPAFSYALRKVTDTPNVHPKGALAAANHLVNVVKNSPEPLSGSAFSSKFGLDEANKALFNQINFTKNGTINLDDFNLQTANKFKAKADLMSELQPEYVFKDGCRKRILSKKQVEDIFSTSEISEPKFLKNAISAATGGRSDDKKAFVSRKKLEKIRNSFDDYALGLEKYAKNKSKNGIITEDIVKKYTKSLNRKNLLIHLAGVAFAAVCLALFIPKAQYWISEKLTGQKDFLGENEINNN